MGRKTAIIGCLLATALIGAKPVKPPSGSPADPRAAYVILTGPGFELRVSNEDGTNSATLYKSKLALRFDLAPRAQQKIVFSEGNDLKVLTYIVNGTGAFATSDVDTVFTDSSRIANLDVSPDGTKVAFATNVNKELRVLDLESGDSQVWTTSPFVWDVAWYKDGNAIAFIAPADTNSNPRYLYEISGPGAEPVLLHSEQYLDRVDASRTKPNTLLLSYNDASGQAYVGLWEGTYHNPSLAGRTPAYKGTLNCDDTKLMFGAPDSSGQTVWYSRDLSMNTDKIYTDKRRANWAQFWPTCD